MSSQSEASIGSDQPIRGLVMNLFHFRDNFVICYELLDEMVDFGYPQTTDAQILQVSHQRECAPVLCK